MVPNHQPALIIFLNPQKKQIAGRHFLPSAQSHRFYQAGLGINQLLTMLVQPVPAVCLTNSDFFRNRGCKIPHESGQIIIYIYINTNININVCNLLS